MQRECMLQLSLLRATRLPSTDVLSKTDAYVKVKVNGALIGQTHVIEDKSDPVWNRDFVATVPLSNNRTPAGSITMELWDQDTFKDSHIATAVLDLSQLNPAAMAYLELPLAFEKAKHAAAGGRARLVVGVKGWISSFGTLLADTQHIPGAMFNPVDNRAYLPLPCPGIPAGILYMAVEYEQSSAVDLKLLVCTPNAPLHVDMFLLGRPVSKVRRRVYNAGVNILPGLVAYEEVKMDDIPLTTDWRQLCVVVLDKVLMWSCSNDDVVSAHGWKGAMGFEDACKRLHGVDIDHSKREIYMPLAGAINPATGAAVPPEALLLVDYDQSNVGLLLSCQPDIKLAVLDCPSGGVNAWDLTLASGQQVKKTSEVFVPAQARAGGKWRVTRVCQLDDVAYGTAFSSILIHKWQLHNQRQWDVQSLIPLR